MSTNTVSSDGTEEEVEENQQEIFKTLIDNKNNEIYEIVNFLGNGTFGKCYEVINKSNEKRYAVKIIPKAILTAEINWEVGIHMKLKHQHIVQFYNYFEDNINLYMVLENCRLGTMRKLLKRRQRITEYECRYYLKQIINAVQYLHQNDIVHRDLKLDNFLLNDGMQIKICDFGFSKVIKKYELMNSVVGTLLYVAPEVIAETGYTFKADIWSLGCAIYELLVGSPPFNEDSLNETYQKLNNKEYVIPNFVSNEAKQLISAMLNPTIKCRPELYELWNFDFLQRYDIPTVLPESIQYESPYKTQIDTISIKRTRQRVPKKYKAIYVCDNSFKNPKILRKDLKIIITHLKKRRKDNVLCSTVFHAHTPLWITKWFDNFGKNAFAYKMCDKSFGVIFTDHTRFILMPDQTTLHYIDQAGEEYHMTIHACWNGLESKRQLLLCFQAQMEEEVMTMPTTLALWDEKRKYCHPQLISWWRIEDGIIMHLSNGVLQINFVDQIKMIFSTHHHQTFIYFDENNERYVYNISELREVRFQAKLFYIINQLEQIYKGFKKMPE